MTDSVDRAQEEALVQADLIIKQRAHLAAGGPPPSPTHTCLFCGEPLQSTNPRFCDASCRDNYELEVKALLRNRG